MADQLREIRKGLKEGFVLPRTKHMEEFIKTYSNEDGIIFTGTHGHYDTPCNTFLFYRWVDMLKNDNRVYLPVHAVVFLLRLRGAKDKNARLRAFKKFLEGWVRSLLFASFYGMIGPLACCYYTDNVGRARPWDAFLLIGMFSSFIFFESPSRWGEMSIYVLANWFEGYS